MKRKPVIAHKFGHPVQAKMHGFIYVDTQTFIDAPDGNLYATPSTRTCPKCHRRPTKDGHDPCIANIKGALGACCGHGIREGYIRLEPGEDGLVVRGDFEFIEIGPVEEE